MSLLRRIQEGQEAPVDTHSKLTEVRVRRQPAAAVRDAYMDLKTRVQNRLIAELDPSMDVTKTDEVRSSIEELFDAVLSEEAIVLSRAERQRLFEQIVAEILGYGPLEPLLADPSITEIMVNGPKNVYVERKGKIERAMSAAFENDEHVMRIIDRIVAPLGRRVDEASPYVDARLPASSRRCR
jgi:pilus assembly protein CpaF